MNPEHIVSNLLNEESDTPTQSSDQYKNKMEYHFKMYNHYKELDEKTLTASDKLPQKVYKWKFDIIKTENQS